MCACNGRINWYVKSHETIYGDLVSLEAHNPLWIGSFSCGLWFVHWFHSPLYAFQKIGKDNGIRLQKWMSIKIQI